VRDIFKIKAFGFILVILLFVVCVYPPFHVMTETGIIVGLKWDWIFRLLPTPFEVPEIDLEVLSVEAIVAFLCSLCLSLTLFGVRKVLRQRGRSDNKANKPALEH